MKKLFILIVSILISITSSSSNKKQKSASGDTKLILNKADSALVLTRQHMSHCSHASHSSHLSSSERPTKNTFNYRTELSKIQSEMGELLKGKFAAKNIDIYDVHVGNESQSGMSFVYRDSENNIVDHDLEIRYTCNKVKYVYALFEGDWFFVEDFNEKKRLVQYKKLTDSETISILSDIASSYFSKKEELQEREKRFIN